MRRLCVVTSWLFVAAVLWDATALDLPLARLFGSAAGFVWRSDPEVVLWLHEVPRWLSSAGVVALIVGVKWPWGPLRSLAVRERLELVVAVVAAMAAVTVLKRLSATSCPWDLSEFGGVASYVSHWNWLARDGGGGHCFPGGHASAAFAYVAAWFALQRRAPLLARRWLAVAVVAGLVLGAVQQVRGAHFMSHTFWSAWVCWTAGLAVHGCFARLSRGAFIGRTARRGRPAAARPGVDTNLNEV